MKKILLVCNAGMSTSMLMAKMQDAADTMGEEVKVEALPISEANDKLLEYDCILLGPQIRFQKDALSKQVDGKVPVEAVDMQAYGSMNGKAVLDFALSKM